MTENEGFLDAYNRDRSAGNLWEWILSDRKAVLERARKPLIGLRGRQVRSLGECNEAIDEALSEINRAIKTMEM